MEKPEKPDFRVIEYPFHLGDLVGGTTNLDDSQFGAYMRLLIANINAQAKQGGLPDNESVLRSYTRMGPAAWKKLWLLIGDKFVRDDGKIYHPRVKETVNEIIKNSNSQRAKALLKNDSDSAAAPPQDSAGGANPKTQKPINHKPRENNPESQIGSRESGDESGSGFSILEKGGAGRSPRGFDIEHHLRDDRDREAAKAIAKANGWDFYHLISEYNAWIAKKNEPPRKPVGAFLAWLKKKGKCP